MTDDLFSATPMSSNPDPLTAAAQAASQEAATLKTQFDHFKSLQKFLEELISYRDKGWLLHLKALCDRESERLKALRAAGHSSIDAIEQHYREAQVSAKGVPATMPSDIERLATSAGLSIDRKSRHPRYFFAKDGFIEARIDDHRLTATISTREGKIATMHADPPAIIEAISAGSQRLFGRKFSGSRFLGDVRKAYKAAVKTRKEARDGEPVPLREIYVQMTKKDKGYKRDEFLVDLSNLVELGPAETSGYKFELQQTKDTHEGILLLGAAGRGMVNLLVFKKSTATPS